MLLNDLLKLTPEQCKNTKIKLNQYNGYDNPIDLFKNDPEEINTSWLFWKNKVQNFSVGQLAICLAQISGDFWLLTTIKKITADYKLTNAGVNYDGVELDEYRGFYGRLVIKFHKTNRTVCPNFNTICNELEVSQLLADTFDDDYFPGYDNVCLSYSHLSSIINLGKKDWIGALKNQKAVYLITDTATGKLYVGSATSDNGMLLQRWKNYVCNGHGDNKELKKLVDEKGFEYIQKNFQYSILENYNAKVDDKVILERESWWKRILCTRQFGYNAN